MRAVRKVGAPTPATLAALALLQGEVDAGVGFPARVERAKGMWGKKADRVANKVAFEEIKDLLTQACWGARRCNYCEDSVADEIEHFRPKDLFPGVVFAWENYLYACGPCNGPKSNRFAVFATPGDPTVTDVTRPHTAAITPPVSGDPVLIDPRSEDPLDYLFLDLAGQVEFAPRPDLVRQSRAWRRAEYTISTMRLNDRAELAQARRTTRDALTLALLATLVDRHAAVGVLGGAPPPSARDTVTNTPHRFVWEEMKRQGTMSGLYGKLFQAVPEALAW